MKTLIIDAGHGGTDKGCSFHGYEEKDLNLIVAKRLQVLLKDYSPDITRTTDKTLSNDKRVGMIANKYEYCLSIHFNANAGDRIEGIHSIFSERGKLLAEHVTNEIKGVFDLPVRVFSRSHNYSTGKGDYYFMHRRTGSTTTVIVECLPLDTQYTNLHLEKIAEAVAEGFKSYIKPLGKPVHEVNNKVVEIDPLSLGSELVYDNANNLAKKYPNFTGGMFSDGNPNWPTKGRLFCLLAIDGKKIFTTQTYDKKPKGTLVIYNDGNVQVNTVRDLASVAGTKLVIQGFNLDYEKNGSRTMNESILNEGWLSDVYRYTTRSAIGYNPSKKKIIIAHITGTANELRLAMRKLGSVDSDNNTIGIGMDGGSMDALVVNGKVIVNGGGWLRHIITF